MIATTETRGANEDRRPWYTEGWLWFVISIPAISIPLGIAMIVIALNTNNSLVVDDYYVQGKTINQRIERDQYASFNAIHAATTPSKTGLSVSLSSQSDDFTMPEVLLIRWVHVTEANRDAAMQLFRTADTNQYYGPWPAATPQNYSETNNGASNNTQADNSTGLTNDAVYRMHLEPESKQWRLIGQLSNFHTPQQLAAKPAPAAEIN